MKYSIKSALASLLFVNCTAFAVTPAEGWYAGLTGGISYSPGLNFSADNPQSLINFYNALINTPGYSPLVTLSLPGYNLLDGVATKGKLNQSVGGDFALQVGYRLCNFRFEGELLFNYSPYSFLKLGGVNIRRHVTPTNPISLSGESVFGAGLFNTYYDFYDEENDPTWVPYIGLGVGYSYIRNTVNLTVPYLFTSPLTEGIKASKSAPIGQIILGLSYYYSDTLGIGLDYRYITTTSLNFVGFSSRAQAHTINLGFNYWFEDSI